MTPRPLQFAMLVAGLVAMLNGCGGGGGAPGASLRADGKVAIAALSVKLVDDTGGNTGRLATSPALLLQPGDEFALPVTVSDASGAAGAAVRLEYDRAVLAPVSVALPAWVSLQAQVARSAGAVAWAGTTAAAPGAAPTVLATFRLKVLATARPQNAVLKLTGVLADARGNTIGRMLAPGASAPRGIIKPQSGGLIGDLNGSGNPEVGSAIKILRVVVGLDAQPSPADLPQWDCNKNSVVDVADAIMVLRCVVGLDPWPIGGQSVMIPAAGGTVSAAGGKVAFVAPAGAVPADTAITVQGTNSTPSGGSVPGAAYQFGPEGTTFQLPLKLTIQYDPANLPAGVREATLTLGKIVSGAWQPITGSVLDTTAHTVSGYINGFSSYGVYGTAGVSVVPGNTAILPNSEIILTAYPTPGEGGKTYSYHWVNTAGYGTIWDTVHFWSGTSLDTDKNEIKYKSRDAEGTDTITLTVYDVTGGGHAQVGVFPATMVVGYRSVTLTPSNPILTPPNAPVVLRAGVSPPFDDTVQIEYHWSNTAQVGQLTDGISGHVDNFISSTNQATYTTGQYGGVTETVEVQVYIKGVSGHGGDTLVGKAHSDIKVMNAPWTGTVPVYDHWMSGYAPLTINTQNVAPGATITADPHWTPASDTDSIWVYCTGAVSATGSFAGSLVSHTPWEPQYWLMGHAEVPEPGGGKAVQMTKDHYGAVTFTIDPAITRSQIIVDNWAGSIHTFHGPAVVVNGNGWASTKMFVIVAP